MAQYPNLNFYEVQVKIPKCFCVLAKDEDEAERLALDATMGDGDSDPEIESVDDLNAEDDAGIIADMKRDGRFLS